MTPTPAITTASETPYYSSGTVITVMSATGSTLCDCGAALADADISPRYVSSHRTMYASALCKCGLFHYVEIDREVANVES
jgi:hypothetical protein